MQRGTVDRRVELEHELQALPQQSYRVRQAEEDGGEYSRLYPSYRARHYLHESIFKVISLLNYLVNNINLLFIESNQKANAK